MGGVARIRLLNKNASIKIRLSTGLVSHLGSTAGGWNGSADWM